MIRLCLGEETTTVPKFETDSDLRDLVVAHAEELPPQQRAIADYLLENLQSVPFLPVPELARRIGVSDATVVRFAKRLGFSGFSDLKVALVGLLQQKLHGNGAEGAADAVSDDLLQSVAALEIGNIERSVSSIDRAHFRGAAEAVYGSAHTYTFGMGISAYLAELAAYTLTQIGVRASCLSTRFTSPREQVVMIDPEDVVVVLSFPPYSRQTLQLLDEAVARKVPTVAVCDRVTSPAGRTATWALPVKSDNMMFTNAVAAVTVLFNALAVEIATTHQAETIGTISDINVLLEDDENIVPPDR